jgi:uncharacterized protein
VPRAISAATARRYLALRQFLAPPRSLPARRSSVMRVFDRLGSVQFDPLEVAGRNHDLVLLARIRGYRREWTESLLYEERVLYETYNKGLSLVPTAELPWYRMTWDRHRAAHEGGAFDEHAPLVEELLARVRDAGPMAASDVKPREAIDWYWRPTNQVRAILEALAEAGILGLARRDGNRRIYDLVERLFPAKLLARRPSEDEQLAHRLLSRYRAHGLLGAGGQAEIWSGTVRSAQERAALRARLLDEGLLVPVEVERLRGERFVPAADLAMLDTAEREVAAGAPPGSAERGVAFLAPLDSLVWDRRLLRDLYRFDYLWEVYVPAAKRRWGYYVLPILFGDRLVGRIEPRIDRGAGALRILGLWWEDGFEPLAELGLVAALAEALEAHRRFGGVKRIVLPRRARHRELFAELRPAMAAARESRRKVAADP